MKKLWVSLILLLALWQGSFSQAHHDLTEVRQWMAKADAFSNAFKFEKANSLIEKAALVFEKTEKWDSLSLCHSKIGLNLLQLEQFDKAILQLDRAKEIANDNLHIPNHALAYHALSEGQYLLLISRNDEALQRFKEALRIYSQLEEDFNAEKAECYIWEGHALAVKGMSKESLESYQEALSRYQVLEGEDGTGTGQCLNSIAIVYLENGSLDEAYGYFQKALTIFRKNYGENSPQVGKVFSNLGIYHWHKKEFDRSMECYQKTLSIYRNVYGEKSTKVASRYNSIALVYFRRGDLENSANYLQKAIDAQVAVVGESHRVSAKFINNLGRVYLSSGHQDKAIHYIKKSLTILRSLYGLHSEEAADSYVTLGNTFLKLEQYQTALQQFQMAVAAAHPSFADTNNITANPPTSRVFFKPILLHGLMAKANGLEETYAAVCDPSYLLNCHRTLMLCDSVATLARASFIEPSDQIFFGNAAYQIAEAGIRVSLLLYDETENKQWLERAFEFSESHRSAVLANALASSDAFLASGIPDSLKSALEKVELDVNEAEKELQQAENQQDSVLIADAWNKIVAAREKRKSILSHVEEQYPKYFAEQYTVERISISDVQNKLLDNSALLEYFIGDQNGYVFKITETDIEVHTLMNIDQLPEMIAELRSSIYDPWVATAACLKESAPICQRLDSLRRASDLLYMDKAEALYQALFAPMANDLPERLIIIPDGVLGYLPFDALLTDRPAEAGQFKDYDFLVKKHSTSYGFSASLLLKNKNAHQQSAKKKGVLSFAPFSQSGEEVVAVKNASAFGGNLRAFRSNDWSPLAFSEKEVENIHTTFGGQAFLGKNATKGNFLELAKDYNILHLSTHAKINYNDPRFSVLAYSPMPSDTAAYGFLSVNDIYTLNLPAEMVVLSACETGLGELKSGEGIISLGRAFTYAGAKSVFTTLWSVQDQATADLMAHFYKHLKNGLPKDDALQSAKLDYLAASDQRLSHPYFWAAMVGLGDMRPLPQGGFGWWWVLGMVVVGAALFGLLRKKGKRT